MVVLSLFDGISSGRVALEKAGIEVDKYYSSEINANAIKVADKNYPQDTESRLGDIRNWRDWKLPKIDLLFAGSPCTGFSFAGKQLNFEDPQSKLFFEFVDILKHYKPKYFLLENTRMRKEYLDIISNILGVQPVLINSADFSAQDRKRYYWTNIPLQKLPIVSKETVEDILEPEVDTKYMVEPRRTVIILDNEVTRRKIGYIGNDSQGNRIYSIHNKSVCLCSASGGLGAKTGLYALPCLTPGRDTIRQNGRRFKPPKSKFYTLTTVDRHGVLTNNFIRKLTPVECERLQTLPDNYTEGISDNQRYIALGNGWTVDVIVYLLGGLVEF